MSKSNELIQMRLLEVERPLGLSEMKVANAVYSKVAPDDEDFRPYSLSVRELAGLAGLDRDRLYQGIDHVTSRLCGAVVKIRRPNNDGFIKTTLFSRAEYIASDGVINFKINPDLIPYLLRLKDSGCGFTQYYLEQTTVLQSKHSLRLYELLRQFLPLNRVKEGQTSGFRKVGVGDLKEYLGLKDRYSRFAELRRAVLEPVQRELAAKTDLSFEFTPERTGRTITSLNFTIRVNVSEAAKKKAEAARRLAEINDECKENGYRIASGNPALFDKIRMAVPALSPEHTSLVLETFSEPLIMESLFDLVMAIQSNSIQTTPAKYFLGILKNKRIEEANAPKPDTRTPLDKLTDRSWMDGLELNGDWEE